MQDIEEIMRDVLKNADQQPPERAWDEIRARMKETTPVQGNASAAFRTWLVAASGLLSVAAIVVTMLLLRPGTDGSETLTTTPATATVAAADSAATELHAVPQGQETPQKVLLSTATEPEIAKAQPVDLAQQQAAQAFQTPPSQPVVAANHDVPQYSEAPQRRASESDNLESAPTATAVAQREQDTASEATAATKPAPRETPEMLTISIPNIVSPNGDGINDCWEIPALEGMGQVQVQIFTAKGQRVYSSSNYRGDFCADGLPDGNYFYQLVIREKNYSRRGVLVIKR